MLLQIHIGFYKRRKPNKNSQNGILLTSRRLYYGNNSPFFHMFTLEIACQTTGNMQKDPLWSWRSLSIKKIIKKVGFIIWALEIKTLIIGKQSTQLSKFSCCGFDIIIIPSGILCIEKSQTAQTFGFQFTIILRHSVDTIECRVKKGWQTVKRFLIWHLLSTK